MLVRGPFLAAMLGLGFGQAKAGAWERPQGESFLALSYNAPVDGATWEGTVSAYFEHGLGRGFTAGLKLDQRPVGPHELEFFLRRNVNPPDAAVQVAIEVGYSFRLDGTLDDRWREAIGKPPKESGEADGEGGTFVDPAFVGLLDPDLAYGAPLLIEEDPGSDPDAPLSVEAGRPTFAVHVGRGFGSPFSLAGWDAPGGWWDMRLGVDLPHGDGTTLGELDATLGLSLSERVFTTLELWYDIDADGSALSVVPGVGVRFGDRYAATARYVRDLDEGVPDSVEFGAWVEF